MKAFKRTLRPVALLVPGLLALAANAYWQATTVVPPLTGYGAFAMEEGFTEAWYSYTYPINYYAISNGHRRDGYGWEARDGPYQSNGYVIMTQYDSWDEETFDYAYSGVRNSDTGTSVKGQVNSVGYP